MIDDRFTLLTTNAMVNGREIMSVLDFGVISTKKLKRNDKLFIIGGMSGKTTECIFDTFLEPDPLTDKVRPTSDVNHRVAIVVEIEEGQDVLDIYEEGYFVFTDLKENTDIDKNNFYSARLRSLSDAAKIERSILTMVNDASQTKLGPLHRLLALTCLNLDYVLTASQGDLMVAVRDTGGGGNYIVYSDLSSNKSGLDTIRVEFSDLLKLSYQQGMGLFFNMDEKMSAPLVMTPEMVCRIAQKSEALKTLPITGFEALVEFLFH